MANTVTTTTVAAEPMSIACDRFISALSAKKSMYAKTTPAVSRRTIHNDVGVMPAAP